MKKIFLCGVIVSAVSMTNVYSQMPDNGSSIEDPALKAKQQVIRERFSRRPGDVSGKTSAAKQEKRVASIEQVKGKDVIIKHSDASKSFLMGDKLHVVVSGESITLEVTFPMQTSSKCRVTSGDAAKLIMIKKGMPVFAGEKAPEGNTSTETREITRPQRLRGNSN